MIKHILTHIGWLLFYGVIWAYIFSYKHDGEHTVFQTGYEYITEKKYNKNINDFYDKNLETKSIQSPDL